jgi:hypothetical protein
VNLFETTIYAMLFEGMPSLGVLIMPCATVWSILALEMNSLGSFEWTLTYHPKERAYGYLWEWFGWVGWKIALILCVLQARENFSTRNRDKDRDEGRTYTLLPVPPCLTLSLDRSFLSTASCTMFSV